MTRFAFAVTNATLGFACFLAAIGAEPTPPKATSAQFESRTFNGSLRNGVRLLYAQVPVAPDASGRPRVFRASDVREIGPALTIEMRATLEQITGALRPTFRGHLVFMFAGPLGRQFFVVYLDGLPEYPVLNNCTSAADCSRICPLYVALSTRQLRPSTIQRCADDLPIWIKRRPPVRRHR